MSTRTVPVIAAGAPPAAGRSTVMLALGAPTPDAIVTAFGRVSAVSHTDCGAAPGAFAQTQVRMRYVGPSARRSGVGVAVPVAVESVKVVRRVTAPRSEPAGCVRIRFVTVP